MKPSEFKVGQRFKDKDGMEYIKTNDVFQGIQGFQALNLTTAEPAFPRWDMSGKEVLQSDEFVPLDPPLVEWFWEMDTSVKRALAKSSLPKLLGRAINCYDDDRGGKFFLRFRTNKVDKTEAQEILRGFSD